MELKHHPIQIRNIEILELSTKRKSNVNQEAKLDGGGVSLMVSNSKYDAERRIINVRLKAEIGKEEDSKEPFELVAEVKGVFKVDDTRFPMEELSHWARNNAPFILYPYVRELVFSMTNRFGYNAAVLPLFEVPTFRYPKEPTEQQGSLSETEDQKAE